MTQHIFVSLHLRHDVPCFRTELAKIRAIRARGTRPQKIGAILYHRAFKFFTRERLAGMDMEGLDAMLRSIACDLLRGLRLVREEDAWTRPSQKEQVMLEECSYPDEVPPPAPPITITTEAPEQMLPGGPMVERPFVPTKNPSWNTFWLEQTRDGGVLGKRHVRLFLSMAHAVNPSDVWIGKSGDLAGKAYSIDKGMHWLELPTDIQAALSK